MTSVKQRCRGKTKAIWRTVEGVEQRRCAKCGEWLPADKEHFYYKRDTLMSQCRPCSRETSRDYQRGRYVPGIRTKPPEATGHRFDASGLLAAFGRKP